MRRTRSIVFIASFTVAMLVASTALAVVYIYIGRGVGSARIGHTYAYAASRLSSTYKTVKDTSYSYTVYHTYVGAKMSNGRYPVELYSKADRKVFRFQVNASKYPTSRGVKVGSSESYLRSKYTSLKGPYTSGYYRRYVIKHSIYSFATYTEFYCRNGTVRYIIVRR